MKRSKRHLKKFQMSLTSFMNLLRNLVVKFLSQTYTFYSYSLVGRGVRNEFEYETS